MSTWLRRLWYLVNRRRHERELVREMQEHRGQMHDPEAFGDTHRLLERSRDAWGWNWLDDAVQDLSVGVRTLLRAPSFAITSTVILAFGIGLNLTLYQMAHVGMIRPPAVESPETLARFYREQPRGGSTSVPYPLTQFVREHGTALSAVLVEAGGNVSWGRDAIEQVDLSLVSTNWFTELGQKAIHGRVFNDLIDAQPGAPPVAMLSYQFWRNRFASDPAVVGSTIYIDKRPLTVIGVSPPQFGGLDFDSPAVYVPVVQRDHLYPESTFLRAWDANSVALYGRLRPGMTRGSARESLRATMQAAAAAHPEIKKEEWLEPHMGSVNFMDEADRAGAWAALTLIASLTTLVMMVAAANLGNLALSRATGRVRELGVRVALGARRGRIVRQLVMESVPLAMLGAGGSVVLCAWVSRVIAINAELPAYLDFSPDFRTVLASLGLAGVSLIAIGVLPAWKIAQQDLTEAIKDGGQNVSRALDRALIRRLMVAAQVAGSCLLLVVAGMMVRGIQRVAGADLGFEYEQHAVLGMPLARYGITGDAVVPYWQQVKARTLSHPEVESAAIVTAPPLGGLVYATTYDDLPELEVLQQSIEPEYFQVMGIPLLAGRNFQRDDDGAVIISRRLAIAMYGSVDVLGRGFPAERPKDTIVAIVADAHTVRVDATNVAESYKPLTSKDFDQVYLVARGRSDPARLLPVLREAAQQDSRVMPTVRLIRDDFDRRVRGKRIAGAVASGIGAMTLLLTCLGIFGVVSYGVALRSKEIGIRTALGADRRALLATILRQVLTPVALGMAVGVAAAVPAGFALSGEPFYLQLNDPLAYVAAFVIFAAASLTAAIVPAAKAIGGNPIEALRHQ